MTKPRVVVVGAGLSGLACAQRLSRTGVEPVVLEAGDAVGGRVRSERVDGFVIDRGFQVLNTAYPALPAVADVDGLDLRHLPRGIRLRRNGRLADVPHPLASAGALVRAARSRAATWPEMVALARYGAGVTVGSPAAIKARPDVAAAAAWAEALPDGVAADILEPFLSGVVLESPITTSRVFTDLMMRMFARGSTALPAAGMQALPELIAGSLPPGAVRLDSPVAEVRHDAALLTDGTAVEGSAVVVAADPWSAHRLLPELGPAASPRGVTTYYYAADPWPGQSGVLTVDADGSGVTNSVVLTASVPEYAADGRSLIATSVLHRDGAAAVPAGVAREIAAELHRAPGADWELVATRHVPHALPAMPAPHALRKPVHAAVSGVWVAGDHRDTSSIQGALVSGRRTAAEVVRSLAGTPAGPRGVATP